jgi:16S rRNA (cytosine1402-N4)-methyltransferase
MQKSFSQVPVMVSAVLEGLDVKPGGRYVDSTLGEGGHSEAILRAVQPDGRVLGIDADPSVVDVARDRLQQFGQSFRAVAGNFSDIKETCCNEDFLPVEGVLFDLGVSSFQLDRALRGFSFQRQGPLDMRFDTEQALTAADVVNTWPEQDLARSLKEYGQEPRSRRIARAIVAARPITSTLELSKIVQREIPGAGRRTHPATRTFQALRIVVNRELDKIAKALDQVADLLMTGGRLAVITYHSLEARIVKDYLRRESKDCICPPEQPVCTCDHKATMVTITKKAIGPDASEIEANPRCRSAKLRVGQRI